ncbi:TrgA family protein [Roseicitreum antarcticum]|uniref:Tellurium resistance protein n=1 Tax=Roseicitreum antarcticum TaxID=564137 RepID=A0A1H3A167_9RHOB|nr:TrgA family protein [Roseicitreum antarcticum]SDX22659.1 hypothetical protein SAMN04488238_106138 [Roseicitreum antarcticum]
MFTLTRATAALLLAVLALVLTGAYRALDPEFRASGMLEVIVALSAGWIGWAMLGPRIDRRVVMGIWATMQALVVAAIVAMAVLGVAQVFRRGYDMEYDGVEEAVLGFFAILQEFVTPMWDAGFLTQAALGSALVGLIVVAAFRWFEGRRKG